MRIKAIEPNFKALYDSFRSKTPRIAPITTLTSRRHTTRPTLVPGSWNTYRIIRYAPTTAGARIKTDHLCTVRTLTHYIYVYIYITYMSNIYITYVLHMYYITLYYITLHIYSHISNIYLHYYTQIQ